MNGWKMIAIVGLALVAGAAWAQPEVEWERTFGGERFEMCYSMIQTGDGGFALVGRTNSFGSGDRDIWLVKVSANGDSLWSRTFGCENGEYCKVIIQTADGGFLLAGGPSPAAVRYADIWIIRTDANGDSLWSRTCCGEHSVDCNSLIQTTDGGFLLAGEIHFSDDNGWDNWDYLLVKITSEGDSAWSRTYHQQSNDNCEVVSQLEDGGFLLAGNTSQIVPLHYDFWIVRTDSLGEVMWANTFTEDGNDMLEDYVQTSDGGFALTGRGESFENSADFWLVRTDSFGNLFWSFYYGGEQDDYGRAIVLTPEGGMVLAGQTNSFGAGQGDFWLIRTDEFGDSLWSCTFGGESHDRCHAMLQLNDGSFVLAGTTNSFGSGYDDFYIVKTTPDPLFVDSRTYQPSFFLLSPAFPNPFNSNTRIEFELGKPGSTRLDVFDPLGRRIAELIPSRTLAAGRYSAIWDANGLASGRYIVRLRTAKGEEAATPVVIVK